MGDNKFILSGPRKGRFPEGDIRGEELMREARRERKESLSLSLLGCSKPVVVEEGQNILDVVLPTPTDEENQNHPDLFNDILTDDFELDDFNGVDFADIKSEPVQSPGLPRLDS